MPELNFKGKEFVYNHHLSVPFRPLVPHTDKSIGSGGLDGNLVIHGDNLHALKALLPTYASKVDCIFIDPPYNTGNESWSYNDNVNSPMIKEWLDSNPVTIEDGLRHDKWLSMMWPRLRLLRELMSESGSLWITLDDNEVHRARAMLDEIFGEDQFVAQIAWEKRYTRSNNTNNFTSVIDQLLVYSKSDAFSISLEERSGDADARYSNPDNDPRGPWKPIPFLNPATVEQRPNLAYEIVNPNTGQSTTPGPKDQAWRNEYSVYRRYLEEDRFYWGADGKRPIPDIKRFLSEVKQGMAPINLWPHEYAGNTDIANAQLTQIMGAKELETLKPTQLVRRVLQLATEPDSIVLDSFAGSGTTAHAVLEQNASDGGERKFILVEMEDYADPLTAERVRRVINGYAYSGTKKEELMREKITWSKLQKVDTLLKQVQSFDNMDGNRFDRIKKEVKDGELIVIGETKVQERAEGLGGTFTYCTLGQPLELDKLLTGETLPSFEALGAVLYHMATSQPFDAAKANTVSLDLGGHGYLGEAAGAHIWLIYQPDLEFLKSREAALTLAKAKRMVELLPNQRHVVYAPARFVSQKMLKELDLPVEFAPLPFALYRMEVGQPA